MTEQTQRHRRWVLASRPHGEPTAEHFRLEESEGRARFCCVPFIYRWIPICAGG